MLNPVMLSVLGTAWAAIVQPITPSERGVDGPLDVPAIEAEERAPAAAAAPSTSTSTSTPATSDPPAVVAVSSEPPGSPSPSPAAPDSSAPAPGLARLREQITLQGYAEVYYAYNWNRPANGITNYRAFDNRHNAITLQNTALDAAWRGYGVELRLALQVGHAPETYYGTSEPSLAGTAGTSASGPAVFKNIQQVYGLWRPGKRKRWAVAAGVFLSPIGPESLAVKDNWSWSHSTLFFALPFYHSGLRVRFDPKPGHWIEVGVVNGWNNVSDNNREKSLFANYSYTRGDRLTLSALYFTGVERPTGAPEGRAWRHLWDLWSVIKLAPRLSALLAVDGGVEPNRFGVSWWFTGMGGLRVKLAKWAYLAARGTYFRDDPARGAAGTAGFAALPTRWVAAATGTFDVRLVEHLSIKLELRHDAAASPIYFRGEVAGDGSDAAPYVANARAQTTTTLGFNAYF